MELNDLRARWNNQVERCGFILNNGEIIEVENIHPQPHLAFEINADVVIKYRDSACASWHTHPSTGPNLSVEDYLLFCQWPQWFHYIVSENDVWCYYIKDNRVILHDENDPPPRGLEVPSAGGASD